LYPIPIIGKLKVYTKQLQEEDIDELRYLYKLRQYKVLQYHSQKFNHPYKLYGFWDTDTGEEYKAAGGLQPLLDAQVRIDLPTLDYRKTLQERIAKGLNKPKEPVFCNCFSVRPVRKSSLIVNQCLKRVCFWTLQRTIVHRTTIQGATGIHRNV
jgi:hypothetical protein